MSGLVFEEEVYCFVFWGFTVLFVCCCCCCCCLGCSKHQSLRIKLHIVHSIYKDSWVKDMQAQTE